MEQKKKGICILGSTGSIGTQALDVVRKNPEHFEVIALAAGSNHELLMKQALEFNPVAVGIHSESGYEKIKDPLFDAGIQCYCGPQAICDLVSYPSVDVVLTAMVGAAGLNPSIAAIKEKKTIALANKETLVVAGHIMSKMAQENGVQVLPVDSEHSAIFQCLVGELDNPIDKIILTASGGPFRGKSKSELEGVTVDQALKHPNWDMGAKITIDSATLMNKGLEVIEAKWLFNLNPNQVDVVVHPQSVIHSMVEFADGSIKAQMGVPDMKLPIQYAFSYPDRLATKHTQFKFSDYPALTFEKPDTDTFVNLALAIKSLQGTNGMGCVLNAVNEVTVAAFLNKSITFLQIGDINQKVYQDFEGSTANTIDELLELDQEVRTAATAAIQNIA